MANTKTSPRGIAHYPHLNSADTKFDADGSYHVKLRVDSEDERIAKFLEWIDAQQAEAIANAIESLVNPEGGKKGITAAAAKKKVKAGDKPYVYIEDEDGEETNEVLVNFKMKATIHSKKTGKSYKLTPKFFDAKGKLIARPPEVWGGSILKVSFTPNQWFTPKLGASVSLRLEAVQIIELVTGGGSENAADYGFGEEEGYEAPDAPAEEEVEAEPGGGDDDDTDGDF